MNSKNYKLPPLPKMPSTPRAAPRAISLLSSGVSKLAGMDSSRATAANFGRPSNSRVTNTQTGSQWSSLVTNAASGGAAGAFSSFTGFAGGIASLVSGLTGLFGGKSAPPPLVEFSLSGSQQQLVTIGGAQVAVGNYVGPQSAAHPAYQSAQIIQTVKQALLNSSSLNDVIAEI